jgi:hypothetical protein
MAPDISKVDPDRHLGLRAAAWNFSNEVMRRLFHGNSLSDLKDLLIPFFGNYRSCNRRSFPYRFSARSRQPHKGLTDMPLIKSLSGA